MRPLFDKRKQRFDRLAALLATTDDAVVQKVLGRMAAPEVSVALKVLPLERANRLLSEVAPDVLAEAIAESDAQGSREVRAAGRLLGELEVEGPASPMVDPPPEAPPMPIPTLTPGGGAAAPEDDPPMCVRALDLAGKVLGTFKVD